MAANHTDVTVREAKDTDAHAIAALYQSLVTDSKITVLPERLRVIADDPHTYLLVCEVDGSVCATALISFCLDAMYGYQPYAVIENVVVAAPRRHQGIGSRLFAHIEDLCQHHHCSKMMLLSGNERVNAHRFFERCGFSATKHGFVKYRRDFRHVSSGEAARGDRS
jgi:N-acetylglutamate synthase-like GNAT family acetyltransferase